MGERRFQSEPWAVERIERQYNAEHDVPSAPCPAVSWVEYTLLQMVLELEGRISALESEGRIATLVAALEDAEEWISSAVTEATYVSDEDWAVVEEIRAVLARSNGERGE